MTPSSPAIGFLLATAGICPLFACREEEGRQEGGASSGIAIGIGSGIGVVIVVVGFFVGFCFRV